MTDNPPRTEDNSPSLCQPSKQKHEPGLGGDAAILHLVECLGSDEWEVRREAAMKLAEIGDVRAIETLTTRLVTENNGDEREVKALANIGIPALPYLASLLRHPDWHVSLHAALSLVQLGDKGIAEAATLLQSDNPQIRWLAVLALEEVEYPHNMPTADFVEALYVRHPFIFDFAARMLGKRNDPTVAIQLKTLMNDEGIPIHIRRRAAASLAFMGYTDGVELLIPVMVGRLTSPWTVWQSLESLGEKAFPFLMAGLENPEWPTFHIADLLASSKHPGVVPAVMPGLKSANSHVRSDAARILGRQADPRATEALIAALEDEDFWVQQCAAQALRAIGVPEAMAAMEQWRSRLSLDDQHRFDQGHALVDLHD